MRQVMSRTNVRRMDLIQFLYDENDWVTLDSIVQAVGCSEKTFLKDIAELEAIFPTIKINNIQKLYRLELENDSDIQQIMKYFLAEIPMLKMVEDMLYKPINHLNEVAEATNSSEPTMYRLLAEFNQFLRKQYNIEIKGRPYYFEGNEVDIRFFYYQYFTERYCIMEWPFPTIDEKPFEELILYFTKSNNLPMKFASFRSMKLMTAVNLLRGLAGHNIENIDDSIREYYDQKQKNPKFLQQAEYFQTTFGKPLDYDQIFDLFVNTSVA